MPWAPLTLLKISCINPLAKQALTIKNPNQVHLHMSNLGLMTQTQHRLLHIDTFSNSPDQSHLKLSLEHLNGRIIAIGDLQVRAHHQESAMRLLLFLNNVSITWRNCNILCITLFLQVTLFKEVERCTTRMISFSNFKEMVRKGKRSPMIQGLYLSKINLTRYYKLLFHEGKFIWNHFE